VAELYTIHQRRAEWSKLRSFFKTVRVVVNRGRTRGDDRAMARPISDLVPEAGEFQVIRCSLHH
jgi:hypothetical protein